MRTLTIPGWVPDIPAGIPMQSVIVFTKFCPSLLEGRIGNKQENPVFFTNFFVNTGNPVLNIGNGFAVYFQILQEHLETKTP